jgi:hypothetical protein
MKMNNTGKSFYRGIGCCRNTWLNFTISTKSIKIQGRAETVNSKYLNWQNEKDECSPWSEIESAIVP